MEILYENILAAFVENLYYMGVGMASILIVMGVLILITNALNKIFSKIK